MILYKILKLNTNVVWKGTCRRPYRSYHQAPNTLFLSVVTKTGNDHIPPASDDNPTVNNQINLFRVPSIYFFRKLERRRSVTGVNKQRVTSLCNLIHTLPYATHEIMIYLFLGSASPELEPL